MSRRWRFVSCVSPALVWEKSRRHPGVLKERLASFSKRATPLHPRLRNRDHVLDDGPTFRAQAELESPIS
jgi:hypothetical protein